MPDALLPFEGGGGLNDGQGMPSSRWEEIEPRQQAIAEELTAERTLGSVPQSPEADGVGGRALVEAKDASARGLEMESQPSLAILARKRPLDMDEMEPVDRTCTVTNAATPSAAAAADSLTATLKPSKKSAAEAAKPDHHFGDAFGELEPEALHLLRASPPEKEGALHDPTQHGKASKTEAMDWEEREPMQGGFAAEKGQKSSGTENVDVDSFIEAHMAIFKAGQVLPSAPPAASSGGATKEVAAGGLGQVRRLPTSNLLQFQTYSRPYSDWPYSKFELPCNTHISLRLLHNLTCIPTLCILIFSE